MAKPKLLGIEYAPKAAPVREEWRRVAKEGTGNEKRLAKAKSGYQGADCRYERAATVLAPSSGRILAHARPDSNPARVYSPSGAYP